jgi:hypothetical protein
LAYSLLEDMVNYRLYETGPLLNGMRQGSGLSRPEVKPVFFQTNSRQMPPTRRRQPPSFGTGILVPKEAALDLVRRYELPQFSW